MTDQPAEQKPAPIAPARKSRTDRYVKLAFLAVALIVVGWLVVVQIIGRDPPGDWQHNLRAALDQAKAENRKVLVIFDKRPPSTEYENMREGTLAKGHNRDAMQNANLILVRTAAGASDPLAQKYKIASRPTTLLLAPDGSELARRVGFIGEMDLKQLIAAEPRQK